MTKQRLKVRFRIPLYVTPRARWRRQIHLTATAVIRRAGIAYSSNDRLELDVRLYLTEDALVVHDVDNRLKDIMDALQGHVQGGGKKRRGLPALIPNDNQIYRVIVEKTAPPKQSHGQGHVTIRRYEPQRATGRVRRP
jgi:Holliday junction resolvase RusA-like endonuclease